MSNTGNKIYRKLEEYVVSTGVATGNEKINWTGDPDYIAPVSDTTLCPISTLTQYILNRASTEADACSSTVSESVTIYQDSTSFNFNQDIFQNSSGTTFAQSGWYSNGSQVRFWGGSSWFGSTQLCSSGGGTIDDSGGGTGGGESGEDIIAP